MGCEYPVLHPTLPGAESLHRHVILVSHDRWFIGQLATRIVDIEATGITDYAGTYDEYVAWCGMDRLDSEQEAKRERQRRAARA